MTDAAFVKWLESALTECKFFPGALARQEIIKVAKAVRAMWKDEKEQLTQEAEALADVLDFAIDPNNFHINIVPMIDEAITRYQKYKEQK